ncbi:hypothetical protein HanPSC8_Chr17g0758601 [Helianthus annuus]|nr:hypothetical protein HanPSC8_Chr17g0758601 [Helianthus annuus]
MASNDIKRSAPRSLYTLMNSGSVKESCKVNSIDSTKPAPIVHSTPKRCATPTITPLKVKNGENKQPVVTPSVKKRMETPVHPSAVGSKTPGQKWQIFSSVSKTLSAYKNKLQSPTVSSPFTLRTEERAARRNRQQFIIFMSFLMKLLFIQFLESYFAFHRFQKLEEKFNEKAAPKVQQQATLKAKAETEFRRFRQSFCFKARPLPSFYNERETPESPIIKTPRANMKSLTPARKPESTVSQPSLTKRTSRRLWKTNDITSHPLSSLARRINHENACPNNQRCMAAS